MIDPVAATPIASATEDALRAGVALRERIPRSRLAEYEASDRDATAILTEQNRSRVPELVPLRSSRMAVDLFSFFRGTAAIMAADLARGASTEVEVISCGDAHLSNFGFFASPVRSLVFDLNDFDEAGVAPFEWDVKRLVTSVVIGGRASAFSEKKTLAAAAGAAAAYRTTLRELMNLSATERYYTHLDTDTMRGRLDPSARAVLDRAERQARKRTSEQFVRKVTIPGEDGRRILVDDPPVLEHVPEDDRLDAQGIFAEYLRTVSADVALLLRQHELTDAARRVVGVGSVGTRCLVVLLTGPRGEPFVLQVKEANPSVLYQYGGRGSASPHEGARVVDNQRVLQAVSDVFLGHVSFNGHDFYVRQFRDMKGSIDLETLTAGQFATYASGCGSVLARAHAQSPAAAVAAGYLGGSETADRALVAWAVAYAEQARSDFEAFRASL